MKTKLAVLLLVAGSCAFAGPRFFVGFGFGGYRVAPPPVVMYAPPPPLPRAAYIAPSPGPGYTWVGGYWYPAGQRYAWRAGYWARPPIARAYWVAPRYVGRYYYRGYWRR